MQQAIIAKESITIPTYELDDTEQSPVFHEMRNHQGTRGAMYPLRMIDTYLNKKSDRLYESIRLENEYIRVVALPELGGRIYEGYDKKLDYHFVYKNNVIKPAMIGLAGAWLSGGIEFNWPTHHRPTTFMPVDAVIEEHDDGSKTAWMGEIEPLYGMKGMIGVTIHPDRSCLLVKTRLYNLTAKTQTFHWWANLAVHANENYQVKFPPDIDYITHHYKNVVSPYPFAQGLFGKLVFDATTDITWYKNIPAAASFFIFNSNYDFMGGYDHGKNRGTVHVADRHISPGKKFFTWGLSDHGKTWQRELTDNDGHYLEIMTGCYTDNQPDFAFIRPDETITFEQLWYATDRLPDIKNATRHAAVSLSAEGNVVSLAFNATETYTNAQVTLWAEGIVIFQKTIDICPGSPFSAAIKTEKTYPIESLKAALHDSCGNVLVEYEWRPLYFADKEVPKEHTPARDPCTIETIEELYLEGLQIEQYRHPLLDSAGWYTEALRRDPGDSRCNNAMGRRALKSGDFKSAVNFFQTAVKRLTIRNQNPPDGESFYYLGIALALCGDDENAIAAFRKAAWSFGWRAAALKEAVKLYIRRREYNAALQCCEEAYQINTGSIGLRLLFSAVLRKLGNCTRAEILARETAALDPLDIGALFELSFVLQKQGPDAGVIHSITRGRSSSLMELAGSYSDAGLYREALAVLSYCNDEPLRWYYAAWSYGKLGEKESATESLIKAETAGGNYCFPSKDREIAILQFALEYCSAGRRAAYFLGLLYYGRGSSEMAVLNWEEAVRRDPACFEAHRCLAIAYHDKFDDKYGALKEMETAFSLHKDSRYLLELVQVCKAAGKTAAQRLRLLEEHSSLLGIRGDLFNEYVTLLNLNGKAEEAAQKLQAHIFHPYEGGEGIVIRQHILAHIELGRRAFAKSDYHEAKRLYQCALEYPENYNEGRRFLAHEAHVYYHLAQTCEKLGEESQFKDCLEKAAGQEDDFEEQGFFKGLALRKLGYASKAQKLYKNMLDWADKGLQDPGKVLYFPAFPAGLPFEQNIGKANTIKYFYARLLGLLGLGNFEEFYKTREALASLTDIGPWIYIILSEMGIDLNATNSTKW
ncbi:MAG: DUF5107 domain-containing protein [Treponema sp.]|nr:DUF5107 domain-containing protein [Treponema sp.]